MLRIYDTLGVLKGLQLVTQAAIHQQCKYLQHIWNNSSMKESVETNLKQTKSFAQNITENPTAELKKANHLISETQGRINVVLHGIQKFATDGLGTTHSQIEKNLKLTAEALEPLKKAVSDVAAQVEKNIKIPENALEPLKKAVSDVASQVEKNIKIPANALDPLKKAADQVSAQVTSVASSIESQLPKIQKLPMHGTVRATDETTTSIAQDKRPRPKHRIDVSEITLKQLKQILKKYEKDGKLNLKTDEAKIRQIKEEIKAISMKSGVMIDTDSNIDTSVVRKKGRKTDIAQDETYIENVLKTITGVNEKKENENENENEKKKQIKKKAEEKLPATTERRDDQNINLPKLDTIAKQRKVPSTRIGRLSSFGGLFFGLGFGTASELTKHAFGFGGAKNFREALLSPANIDRIVDTLCKVRGAALKIGQILSIQDSGIVAPHIAKAFDRVRQSADYMPDWQVDKTISRELGPEWRESFKSFEDKPFAAASIGQVHRAILKNDMPVAVKIQYPGVAESIESDIDNLVGLLKIWDIFPKGVFIDNVVKVAKRELTWEVDYIREAEYTEKFKEMITEHKEYYVPNVIRELSTRYILVTELVPGIALDMCVNLTHEHRKIIGESVLKLCLRELFQLQCMQTDPNWSNFLYDEPTKRLMLIDFGSTRFYTKEFMRDYRDIIVAAVDNDRQKVLDISNKMGFLTGYETKQMQEAHVTATMILGEIFREDGEFDFGTQKTIGQVAQLVPTMIAHRLCPPPEEIYSIHRKISGVFLLCAKLKVKMNCSEFYDDIVIRNPRL